MHKGPSRFQEVGRILRENEQFHQHVGCLEAQNHRVSEELRTTVLKLEWIATIAREGSGVSPRNSGSLRGGCPSKNIRP
jgi:hypothetical protein